MKIAIGTPKSPITLRSCINRELAFRWSVNKSHFTVRLNRYILKYSEVWNRGGQLGGFPAQNAWTELKSALFLYLIFSPSVCCPSLVSNISLSLHFASLAGSLRGHAAHTKLRNWRILSDRWYYYRSVCLSRHIAAKQHTLLPHELIDTYKWLALLWQWKKNETIPLKQPILRSWISNSGATFKKGRD